MSRYQIKYSSSEVFNRINWLVHQKTGGKDYFHKYRDNGPEWYIRFSYYLIDKETFEFSGLNYSEREKYTTITIEELEKLMMKNQSMNQSTKIYQGDAYHFFVKSELYANLALSLFKKYGFTSNNARKKYPVNWVIRPKSKTIGWNEAYSTSNPVVPIDEWEDCLACIVNNSPIEINGYEVEFLPNKAIRVGCTVVDFDTLKKVWENLRGTLLHC